LETVELKEQILSGTYENLLFISLELESLMNKFLTLDPRERPILDHITGQSWMTQARKRH
jgi:hypothetical protein